MKSLSMRFAVAVAVGFAALVLTGCSGSITSSTEMVFDPPDDVGMGEPADSIDASFTQVRGRILVPSCALSGCHGDFEFPNLSASNAYGNTVGVASSSGQPLIDPGAPSSSYLYLKVTNHASIQGGQMPRGGPQLSEELTELLRLWIERGALND